MTLDDLEARIASLEVNLYGEEGNREGSIAWRLREIEKYFDTLQSPFYKRWYWRWIARFGPWYYNNPRRP